MLSNIKTLLTKHFSEHIALYFMVILCFAIGLASGVFSVKALSQLQKEQLVEYLSSSFKATLLTGEINNLQILYHSIINNFKTLLIIWALAISAYGFPLIFLTIGARGFSLGFTMAFLIENIGYKGILFIMVSMLPQNIIILPVFIALCVVSVSHSLGVLRNRKAGKYVKREKLRLFVKYNFIVLLNIALLMVGSLIEAYVSPMFLKGIIGYLMS